MKRLRMRRPIAAITFWAVAGAVLSRVSFRSGRGDRDGLSRGRLLGLGGFGVVAVFAGAGRATMIRVAEVLAAGRDLRRPTTEGTSLLAQKCAILAPEETQGPYYIQKEKIRSNIRENRKGVALKLKLDVIDVKTCLPIKNAAVDIWHCDGTGIYSGFISASKGGAPGGGPTDKHTFLRGIQFTDDAGTCEFETVYPGWYRGRTVHIHVMVHLDHKVVGHVAHTGQLYFSDALTAHVYHGNEPYRGRAAQRDTFNNTDGIYLNGGGEKSMITMRKNGTNGYIGTMTLGVRRK